MISWGPIYFGWELGPSTGQFWDPHSHTTPTPLLLKFKGRVRMMGSGGFPRADPGSLQKSPISWWLVCHGEGSINPRLHRKNSSPSIGAESRFSIHRSCMDLVHGWCQLFFKCCWWLGELEDWISLIDWWMDGWMDGWIDWLIDWLIPWNDVGIFEGFPRSLKIVCVGSFFFSILLGFYVEGLPVTSFATGYRRFGRMTMIKLHHLVSIVVMPDGVTPKRCSLCDGTRKITVGQFASQSSDIWLPD